jgi:hypothetical protein
VFRLTLANDVLILFEGQTKSDTERHDEPVIPAIVAPEIIAEQTSEDETAEIIAEQLVSELPQETETIADNEERPERIVQVDLMPESDEEKETIAPLPSPSVISKAASALHSITSLRKPNVRTVIFDDDDAKTRISRLTRR